jgi:hypothetical protein
MLHLALIFPYVKNAGQKLAKKVTINQLLLKLKIHQKVATLYGL